MKKSILVLLLVCLLALSLTACGGVNGPESLGHRYGDPEIAFADGQVIITYICVDCDYTETETRTASTQIADAAAWDTAFQNLSLTKYSFEFRTYLRDEVEVQRCIVTEDRAYYSSEIKNAADPNRGESYASEPEAKEEFYTLQKEDGTYITYLRSAEDGSISLAPETDDSYWNDIKNASEVYLPLAGKFDQFTYDAESGSYICTTPMEVTLVNGKGEPIGVKTLQYVCVNIADGQILSINAEYSEVNEFLETINMEVTFYNIGYSVVKVPRRFIEAVTKSLEPNTPMESLRYEIKNGEIIITGAKTNAVVDVTIPAMWENYPVVAIDNEAFVYCESLTKIVIPKSIVSIGDDAFRNCRSLVDVVYQGTEEEWSKIAIGQTGNDPLLNATIQFRAACEHSYNDGVVTKEPTCGAMGIKTYTCTTCGDTKIEYLAKHSNHSFNEGVVTEEPTCNEAGIKTYTCSVCGKNKTEYIPKLATHTYTNGTCTSCGADDPHYADNTDGGEKEIGGIIGAILRLVQSIIDVFSFF